MNTYLLMVSFHVLIAILGIGQIAAVAVICTAARNDSAGAASALNAVQRILVTFSFSLLLQLLTGVLLALMAGGELHRQWWFRISFLLLIGLGALAGPTSAAIRKAKAKPSSEAIQKILGVVFMRSWLMVGVTAVIAVLMELKPF